ncbi:MAG TPA: DUF202 domain-containing protein, partial [bacterium]|nr:DUF202 domain-containing protein [bacterium]
VRRAEETDMADPEVTTSTPVGMTPTRVVTTHIKVPGIQDSFDQELKVADVLSAHRTRMASERTLMGWIRTSISMMTFGFTLAKTVEYVLQQGVLGKDKLAGIRADAPLRVGYFLVILATLALAAALIQHWTFVRGLPKSRDGRRGPVDLAVTTAAAIVILGVFIMLNLFFRIGPL